MTSAGPRDSIPRSSRLRGLRRASVSFCLLARNEVAAIGPILRCLMPLLDRGAVDQIVVVDDSVDGTGELAEVRRRPDRTGVNGLPRSPPGTRQEALLRAPWFVT